MYRSSERLRHLITLRLVTRTLMPGRLSAFRDFRWPVAIWPSSPPATQEILGFACLVGFTGFAQDENASIDLVVRGSLLPPTLHAARTNPWVYRIIWDSHRSYVLHFPGQRPGLLDTWGHAKDGSAADPSTDAASVIADQEPLALSRFDQMQVLAPATSHEDNVADGGIALAKRYDRDPGRHR